MSRLERASALVGRPVITLAGESPGDVKDVVLGRKAGGIVGFTLNDRGALHGPLDKSLPFGALHALGTDAVMIEREADLVDDTALTGDEVEVVDVRVLTDDGVDLGIVHDVILELNRESTVVGFEIETSSAFAPAGRRLLIPFDSAGAVSEEALVVPAAARDYVEGDLTGFGAAVDSFRSRLANGDDKS